MRRRALALAVVWVAAVVLSGCSTGAAGREFSTEFAPINMGAFGSVNRGPLPVELRDLTGLVVAIATDVDRPDDDISGPNSGALPMAGSPSSIRAYWLGGMCTAVVRMELRGVEHELALAIRDEWDPPIFGGSCPAGGVPRVLAITFDRPIDVNDLVVERAHRS